MSTKAKRHIHKYHKINLVYTKLWACAFPDCTHHMPKHLELSIINKYSFCWDCEEQFILDEEAFKMDKPICLNCRLNSIEPGLSDKLSDFVSKIN